MTLAAAVSIGSVVVVSLSRRALVVCVVWCVRSVVASYLVNIGQLGFVGWGV